MFRNMVTSLFKHERIRTTGAKAKELRRWADHLITLAKRGDLHARRQALAIVREKQVVHKLFEEANAKFGHSAGGYTRIVKLGRRAGDAAPMSLIELVAVEPGGKKKTKKKATKRGAAKSKTAAAKKTAADTKDVKKPAEKKEVKTESKQKSETKKKAAASAKEEKSVSPKTTGKKSETKSKSAAKTKSATAAKEKVTDDKPKGTPKKKADKDEDQP
jgi:large subunit ribosomal protein L17